MKNFLNKFWYQKTGNNMIRRIKLLAKLTVLAFLITYCSNNDQAAGLPCIGIAGKDGKKKAGAQLSCSALLLTVANSTNSSNTSGTPTIALSYVQRNGTEVSLNTGAFLPPTAGTAQADSRSLYNADFSLNGNSGGNACPVGSTREYTFKIANSGNGAVTSDATISVSKTSDSPNPRTLSTGQAGSSTFEVSSQPTLPIASGASSTFKVKLTHNGSCQTGYKRGGYFATTAKVTVSTTDPTNPNYTAEFEVFGIS
jgi:hypothetical protein